MNNLETFDEVFEQLYHLYQGRWIQVQTKRAGLTLSDFPMLVQKLQIRPLNSQQLRKKLSLNPQEKFGLIVIQGSTIPGGKITTCLNIPFKLGFNTVDARVTSNFVLIKTCGFEFSLSKLTAKKTPGNKRTQIK